MSVLTFKMDDDTTKEQAPKQGCMFCIDEG